MHKAFRNITILFGLGGLLLLFAACAANSRIGEHADQFDLSRYGKVLLEPVTVSFDESWEPVETGSHMGPSEAERERIREQIAALFDKAFRAELTRNEAVQLVDEPGPGVLQIKPELVEVRLNAPLERSALPSDVYARNIGSVTLDAKFHDSVTGELLLTLHDRMQGDSPGLFRLASPVFTRVELTRIFEEWAEVIRREIFRKS